MTQYRMSGNKPVIEELEDRKNGIWEPGLTANQLKDLLVSKIKHHEVCPSSRCVDERNRLLAYLDDRIDRESCTCGCIETPEDRAERERREHDHRMYRMFFG